MSKPVAIIKYNAGNIRSVQFALERLGVESVLTDDHARIRSARRVIFPGVGEAGSTMKYLRERDLDTLIASLDQSVLGICLGLQLMCRHSEEGDTPCIGIFDEEVKRFQPGLKVPHMGWNQLEQLRSPLFRREQEMHSVYFVHSYYVPLSEHTIAQTNYGTAFSAAMKKDNFYATQFHPEKSGRIGEEILRNFLAL